MNTVHTIEESLKVFFAYSQPMADEHSIHPGQLNSILGCGSLIKVTQNLHIPGT